MTIPDHVTIICHEARRAASAQDPPVWAIARLAALHPDEFYVVFASRQLLAPNQQCNGWRKLRNDYYIDYSTSVVCIRWWGLGVFSLARVAPDDDLTMSSVEKPGTLVLNRLLTKAVASTRGD